jgi:hypothetical protein
MVNRKRDADIPACIIENTDSTTKKCRCCRRKFEKVKRRRKDIWNKVSNALPYGIKNNTQPKQSK